MSHTRSFTQCRSLFPEMAATEIRKIIKEQGLPETDTKLRVGLGQALFLDDLPDLGGGHFERVIGIA